MPNDIQDQLGRARDFAEEKSALATGKLKEGAAIARETATEALETGKDIAVHVIESGRETAERAYVKSKNAAYDLSDKTNRIFQEHPLTAVAAAVTAGAIIAAVLPSGARNAVKARVKQAPDLVNSAARAGKGAASSLAGIAVKSAASAKDRAEKVLGGAVDAVDTASLKSQVGAFVTKTSDAITSAGKAAADTVRKKSD